MDTDLFENILNISRRMAGTRALKPLLNYVVVEGMELVGAERGYIVLVNADGVLDFRVKRDKAGKEVKQPEDQISKSVLKKAIDTREPIMLDDALHDSRFNEAESVIILGLRSIMCVPLIARGNPIGAIYVENRSIKGRFTKKHLQPLTLFANQAAIAIENATLNEDLEARVQKRTKALQKAKADLEKSWSEAVEANRLRTEWSSKVVHDLRSPLTIVATTLELLQNKTFGDLNEEQLEWVKKSYDTVKHIENLTKDLFDISRLDVGGITLERENVDLGEFLQNVYQIGQGLPWPKDVDFKLDIRSPLPNLFIDPRRIQQVLINLFSNALKFTTKGNVTFHTQYLPTKKEVNFGVVDTGEGISADKQLHLFQRFKQVDDNYERRRLGSGLGLAICRELVEMHGGRIWIESTPGVGSNFMFALPLHTPKN